MRACITPESRASRCLAPWRGSAACGIEVAKPERGPILPCCCYTLHSDAGQSGTCSDMPEGEQWGATAYKAPMPKARASTKTHPSFALSGHSGEKASLIAPLTANKLPTTRKLISDKAEICLVSREAVAAKHRPRNPRRLGHICAVDRATDSYPGPRTQETQVSEPRPR